MKKTRKRVPVSERALIARLRRALAKEGESLRASRSNQTLASVGAYYTVDIQGNCIARQNIDIETLARSMNVLAPHEEMTH